MKIRNLLVSGFSLCVLGAIPQPAEAQFFKKISNMLETVDKALGGDASKSNANTEKTDNDEPQAGTTVNGIHQATLYDGKTTMKCPVVTSSTKVISVDVSPDIYVDMASYSDGVAFVKVDKKCFFVDTLGNKVLDYNYGLPFMRAYPRFYQGVCPAKKGMARNMSLIDKTGKVVMELPVYDCTNFVDGVAAGFISVQKGYSKVTKVVYFNTKGEPVYNNLIEEVKFGNLETPRPLCEGLAAHYSYSKQLYGFRDENGNLVIAPSYSKVQNFNDGLAAVQTASGKWGYIDKTGKMVIEAKFSSEPGPFSEGYAVVEKRDGSKCYIDKQRNIAFDGLKDASYFHNGKAFVRLNNSARYSLALIDKNFKVVSEFHTNLNSLPLEDAVSYSGDDILISNCFVTDMGDMILGAERLKSHFSDGLTYCVVWQEGGKTICGCTNRKGELVFIFKESEF